MSFHGLDKGWDEYFHSAQVNMDIPLIIHRSKFSLLLCYVDYHDNAYHWAERRKLETYPKTRAVQIVKVRGMVRGITVPRYEALLEFGNRR